LAPLPVVSSCTADRFAWLIKANFLLESAEAPMGNAAGKIHSDDAGQLFDALA
jgi:hypothetical protein